MNKNRERALKAWETIRKNKLSNLPKKEIKSYDRTIKNEIREDITKLILTKTQRINDNFNYFVKKYNILSLETKDYLFVNKLLKHDHYIAQHDKKEMIEMVKNKPDSVKCLYYGDISFLSKLNIQYDVMYFDFCCGINKGIDIFLPFVKKSNKVSILGFTFCLRSNKKREEDYRLLIMNKLQSLLKIPLKIEYYKSYKDKNQPPMVTIFFSNQHNCCGFCGNKTATLGTYCRVCLIGLKTEEGLKGYRLEQEQTLMKID